MARKSSLPDVPRSAHKGRVVLVWKQSANDPESPKELRATYTSFDEAMLQAYGDRRPGRLEPCPTCGSHVAGGPSGHGLFELGYEILRVEDGNGAVVWQPGRKERKKSS